MQTDKAATFLLPSLQENNSVLANVASAALAVQGMRHGIVGAAK